MRLLKPLLAFLRRPAELAVLRTMLLVLARGLQMQRRTYFWGERADAAVCHFEG